MVAPLFTSCIYFGDYSLLRQHLTLNFSTYNLLPEELLITSQKMSYNPRMSMVPNSQQQSRGKKKEEDSDAFMRLVTKFPSLTR